MHLIVFLFPLFRDGVSRASAYHHYGMVSPFKFARDLHAVDSNGAKRYADEFFTWRHVAHVYCFHKWPAIDSLQVSADVDDSWTLYISLHPALLSASVWYCCCSDRRSGLVYFSWF